MMRSKYKNRSYFKKYINLVQDKAILRTKKKLALNDTGRGSIMSLKFSLCESYLKLIYLNYSIGNPIAPMKDYIKYAIDYISDNGWISKENMTWKEDRKGDVEFLPEYWISAYYDLLKLLSFATLFDLESVYFKKISNIIDNDGVKDHLLEYFLSQKIERTPIKKESYTKYFFIQESFSKLREVAKSDDQEKSQDLLIKYLKKDWKKNFRDMGGNFKQHEKKFFLFKGYWSIEVAAMVKIKGIDDSPFRDHEYYPKDFLHQSTEVNEDKNKKGKSGFLSWFRKG